MYNQRLKISYPNSAQCAAVITQSAPASRYYLRICNEFWNKIKIIIK